MQGDYTGLIGLLILALAAWACAREIARAAKAIERSAELISARREPETVAEAAVIPEAAIPKDDPLLEPPVSVDWDNLQKHTTETLKDALAASMSDKARPRPVSKIQQRQALALELRRRGEYQFEGARQ